MSLKSLSIKKIWGYKKGDFSITYMFYENKTTVEITIGKTVKHFVFE